MKANIEDLEFTVNAFSFYFFIRFNVFFIRYILINQSQNTKQLRSHYHQ